MNSVNINNPYMYNVGLYIRLSKEDLKPQESESVSNQRSILKRFCEDNNLKIIDEYVDDGISGTTFNRPSFMRMIKDIEERKINMVITKDLSRLGRDYIGIGHYLEKYFPENKVRYISILDGIDTGVDSNLNDITPFKSILNDMYAKDISNKIKSVKHNKQELGLFIGPKAPYGYILDKNYPNRLFIDKNVKHIIKGIFSDICEGKSCRQVCNNLNKENVLTPSMYAINSGLKVAKIGSFWSPARIREIILNEVYIGNMVQGRMKKINYKSKKNIRLPRNEWKVILNTHEAIISKDIFEKAGKMIELRKKTRVKSHDYTLKGLIYCHECRNKMGCTSRNIKGKVLYYLRCNTHAQNINLCISNIIKLKLVENIVITEIKELINNFACLDNMRKILEVKYNNMVYNNQKQNRIDELKKALNNVTHQIDIIYSDKLSGVISYDDFRRIYDKKSKEKKDVLEKINKLEEKVSLNSINKNEFIDGVIKEFIENLEIDRKVISEFIVKVEVSKENKIYILFNCDISN